MNPVHEYIAQQRRAFEETFPALYDHSDKCINDEIAAFLTSSLTGLLDIIEHEIDALFETEQSMCIWMCLRRCFMTCAMSPVVVPWQEAAL